MNTLSRPDGMSKIAIGLARYLPRRGTWYENPMEGISRICRRVRLSLESFLPSFFSPSPFSRTRDQCHHQHPFYSNFVHFVSLVQPLVKLLEPPSRVSCVVREYRVLDLSLHFIEFEFSSNRVEEEILLFLESKSPRRGNFSQIFILPLQISLLSIFAKNEAKRAKNKKSFYTFSLFLTIFSLFFVFFFDYSFLMSPFHECLAKEIHILPRCYTEAAEHNYTG